MSNPPKISFGMIVLNGQPFLPYNIRCLYPYAHEIIICEGASFNAKHLATKDGHSSDGTLEFLREFVDNEDHDKKVRIITAEDEGYPNGFWLGEKDEQSKAYAKRVTGDWLWQVDVDEFYRDEDIKLVMNMLYTDTTITAITFPEIPFWGSFDYRCDGPYLRYHYSKFHRLFKWKNGFTYETHRPPTVLDQDGNNLRKINWVNSEAMADRGIYLHHYTQIFSAQVKGKMIYYENLISTMQVKKQIIRDTNIWYERTFNRMEDPYHVHTVNTWYSWLEPFKGRHPKAIQKMHNDIKSGDVKIDMRNMDDVEALLDSKDFKRNIKKLKRYCNYVDYPIRLCRNLVKGRISLLGFLKEITGIITGTRRIFTEV